jgi:hypothetical protein
MKIFKFSRVNQHLYENLINNSLWFSTRDTFNDPFEGRPRIAYGASKERINELFEIIQDCYPVEGILYSKEMWMKLWVEDSKKAERLLQDIVQTEIGYLGVCCFCMNYKDIKMWSHYADSHKGICLSFDTGNEELFDQSIKHYKVDYQAENLDYDFFCQGNILDSLMGMTIIKSKVWESEEEYRFIAIKPGMNKFHKHHLNAIYFGISCNPITVTTIMQLVNSMGYKVDFFQVDRIFNDYQFNFRKLDLS